MKKHLGILALLSVGLAAFFLSCMITEKGGTMPPAVTVKIARAGGIPISPFAFGNNYYNWVDWKKNGQTALPGTEEPIRALGLDLMVGDNNHSDANTPQLFDKAEMDKYIIYCRTVGAEPLMIAPVYGNNVNGGPTSAKGAADIVTYINGTRKYGVQYWTIGCEVDIYDIFFKTTKGLPVSTAEEYSAVILSYGEAMKKANAATGSGVTLKFVGPELGMRYFAGDDWLSPILDKCKDYIDVASIHAYGFAANQLNEKDILNDVDNFRWLIKDVKARVAKHARPGTPLAVTEANICWEWDPSLYTPKTRALGPGTFYAAIWDADRMGAALEADLWTLAFWDVAETVQLANDTVFGFIITDPSKKPPTVTLTPEYYAQMMVTTTFSGTTVIPSGVPADMSVYASYDATKASTTILVLNKGKTNKILTFAIDNLTPRTFVFIPMSIKIVIIPDKNSAKHRTIEYTMTMANAGLPPKITL